jgi:hypothetical protein
MIEGSSPHFSARRSVSSPAGKLAFVAPTRLARACSRRACRESGRGDLEHLRSDRVDSELCSPSLRKSAMPATELLQFEVIRTIAASLISVSIVLLWLLVMTGK